MTNLFAKKTKEKHGCTGTTEYYAWNGMRQRCYNPHNPRYKHYGARGIKLCERWEKSFTNFLEDMGYRPSPLHQIDRIDNNGDYSPENCHWLVITDNCRKTSRNKLNHKSARLIKDAIARGEKAEDIAKQFGIVAGTVRNIKYGDRWADA